MGGNAIRAGALVLAVVMAAGTGLDAQQGFTPYVGGGVALGTGDLANDSETGWTLLGGLDVPIGLAGLTVGPVVSYTRIPYGGGFSEAEGVTAVFGEAGYRLGAGSPSLFQPYVRAGLGLHVHRYDPGSIATNATTLSRAGASLGAGLHFALPGFGAFIGARFVGDMDRGFVSVHGGLSLP
jgi:opacity protein-like surface antigen